MRKSCHGCDRYFTVMDRGTGQIIHSCKGVRMNYLAGMAFPKPNRIIDNPNKRPAWCPKEAR